MVCKNLFESWSSSVLVLSSIENCCGSFSIRRIIRTWCQQKRPNRGSSGTTRSLSSWWTYRRKPLLISCSQKIQYDSFPLEHQHTCYTICTQAKDNVHKNKFQKLPKCRHYTVLFLKYIDEWFLKYIYKWIENVWQETQAIHMGIHPGSYVEVNIPWMTGPEGYTTMVHGQLLLVDATTSLQYRSLVECETFEVRTKTDTAVHLYVQLWYEFTCMLEFFWQFTVKASYPLTWNSHQDWTCDFIACKATVCLIFEHKHFLTGRLNERIFIV